MISMAFNAFSENTVVLHDGTGGAIVIDPGMSTPAEWDRFERELADKGWTRAVLLTHAHLDHVLGCAGMIATGSGHGCIEADQATYLDGAPGRRALWRADGSAPAASMPSLWRSRCASGTCASP